MDAEIANCTERLSCTPEVAETQGYIAGEQGYLESENPYPTHTVHFAWWRAGYYQFIDDLCGNI